MARPCQVTMNENSSSEDETDAFDDSNDETDQEGQQMDVTFTMPPKDEDVDMVVWICSYSFRGVGIDLVAVPWPREEKVSPQRGAQTMA